MILPMHKKKKQGNSRTWRKINAQGSVLGALFGKKQSLNSYLKPTRFQVVKKGSWWGLAQFSKYQKQERDRESKREKRKDRTGSGTSCYQGYHQCCCRLIKYLIFCFWCFCENGHAICTSVVALLFPFSFFLWMNAFSFQVATCLSI